MSRLIDLLKSPEAQAAQIILAGVIDIAGLGDEINQGEDFIEIGIEDAEALEGFLNDAIAMEPDLNQQLGAAVALIILFANRSGSQKFISIASKLQQLYTTYTGNEADLIKLIEAFGVVFQTKKRAVKKLQRQGNITETLIDPLSVKEPGAETSDKAGKGED